MIVVHLNAPSTKMLSIIYEDIKDVTFFDSWKQRAEILKAIDEHWEELNKLIDQVFAGKKIQIKRIK
jgi:hypothetical protein